MATITRDSAHSNVAHLFGEDARRSGMWLLLASRAVAGAGEGGEAAALGVAARLLGGSPQHVGLVLELLERAPSVPRLRSLFVAREGGHLHAMAFIAAARSRSFARSSVLPVSVEGTK